MHQNNQTSLREIILSLLIPTVYLLYVIILLKTGSLPKPTRFTPGEVLAGLAVIGGFLLWSFSYFFLPPTFYLYPRANKLVTSGPYRYLRHPIYVGAMTVFFGLSYLGHSGWAFWYAALVILPLNVGRALWEERILLEVFGKKYQRYQKQTLC